jgi:hypothetical protein
MRAGEVKMWLDQGPAILLAKCAIESQAATYEDRNKHAGNIESGWVISLLQTGEVLTVHEETLHNGEYQ